MAVAVVTDSTHYLPADLIARHDVHVVSLYVTCGETPERESEIGDLDAFYERLRTASEAPTTSQPSQEDFLEAYEPLLDAGHDIVSIHLSRAISGTHDSALQARARLAERGLGNRVAVIDSRSGAAGLGLAAIAAANRARIGLDLAAVAARATDAAEHSRSWFCLDTLKYLRRGGHGAQAWAAGALRFKPILTIDGEIRHVERVRTAGRAFDRMVEYLRTLHADGLDGWLVQHIQAPDQAERLVHAGRELFGSEPLFVSEVGPALGVQLGPGMIGVAGIPTSALR